MDRPSIYIVMGVSGCGKSTLGQALAQRLALPFYEGDDFHPADNLAKLRAGQALNDRDRGPWLALLRQKINHHLSAGNGAVLSCSALKRTYRDQLGREPAILYVWLDADSTTLTERLNQRTGHFMPASLLASQLACLEQPAHPEQYIRLPAQLSLAEQLALLSARRDTTAHV